MAYDEILAHRVREQLQDQDGVSEMAMFGGLAFLVHGNLCVAVSSRGGLLARIGHAESEAVLGEPHVEPMEMRGRRMRGWVFVAADGVTDARRLRSWVQRALSFTATLPAKGEAR